MRNLLKLLLLFKPYWGWAAAGVVLSVLTIIANIALMTTSAWFITAMAGAWIAAHAVLVGVLTSLPTRCRFCLAKEPAGLNQKGLLHSYLALARRDGRAAAAGSSNSKRLRRL